MDKEFRKKLDDYIRVRLTEKRYRHTEGVIYTAVRLAERYGADPEKAEIAALFHDACKNLDIEEMNTLVEEYQLGDYYIDKPQLAPQQIGGGHSQSEIRRGGRGYSQCRQLSHHGKSGYESAGKDHFRVGRHGAESDL